MTVCDYRHSDSHVNAACRGNQQCCKSNLKFYLQAGEPKCPEKLKAGRHDQITDSTGKSKRDVHALDTRKYTEGVKWCWLRTRCSGVVLPLAVRHQVFAHQNRSIRNQCVKPPHSGVDNTAPLTFAQAAFRQDWLPSKRLITSYSSLRKGRSILMNLSAPECRLPTQIDGRSY